jgi:lipoprotein-anchoring transpeptidase ErfK/SrfK
MKSMNTLITIMATTIIILTGTGAANAATYYGQKYCNVSGYHCIKAKKGATWESLFPDAEQRDVVRRLNRMNTRMVTGMTIAVPNNLSSTSVMDISPMPSNIDTSSATTIMVDKSDLAWGAYNSSGELVNWGPISGGKGFCKDTNSKCQTVTGNFKVQRKQGAGCISTKFPVGKGGAKMPYCMFFHGGYALHGSYSVPGYNDSHGCVRLFVEDAQWLNTQFIDIGNTKVIIQN